MAEPIVTNSDQIAAALEENIAACWRAIGLMPGADLYDTPEMVRVITDLPIPSFNGVARARLDMPAGEAMLIATLETFRRRDVPMVWLVGPTTRPADLGAMLTAHGLEQLSNEPGMAVELKNVRDDRPAPAGLVVERVDDPATLREWCGFAGDPVMIQRLFDWLSIAALGEDRLMINYLGRLDGRPVATASLVLAAGVAGIYNISTVPDVQRRGIGSHMTITALRDAQAAGYHFGVLHSSRMGVELYRRLGFWEVCRIGQYGTR